MAVLSFSDKASRYLYIVWTLGEKNGEASKLDVITFTMWAYLPFFLELDQPV